MNHARKLEAVSNDIPEPPYPADVLANGWKFELDLGRATNSDTWVLAPADMRPWLLMLWCTSWTQTPCGSLSASDPLIAAHIGMDPRIFAANRDALMRGWYRCADGRLYHPVVTELVERMRDGRKAERDKKARQRAAAAAALAAGPAGVPGESPGCPPTGTGSGTGTGEKTKSARKRAGSSSTTVSVEQMKAEGVNVQHAKDWLVARKAKRLPLTPTAWEDTKAEAAKARMSIADAVHTAAINSWAGFKFSWLDRPDTKRISFTAPGQGTTPGESTDDYLARREREAVAERAERERAQSPESLAAKRAAIDRVKGRAAA